MDGERHTAARGKRVEREGRVRDAGNDKRKRKKKYTV